MFSTQKKELQKLTLLKQQQVKIPAPAHRKKVQRKVLKKAQEKAQEKVRDRSSEQKERSRYCGRRRDLLN
jgi:hypothetical protein